MLTMFFNFPYSLHLHNRSVCDAERNKLNTGLRSQQIALIGTKILISSLYMKYNYAIYTIIA